MIRNPLSHAGYQYLRWAAALATLVLGLALSCSRPSGHTVVLIIVDTLRADHLRCYGYESIETPNIDRLAAEGTLFENAVTAVPVTLPSIATILSGAYPAQHGVRDNGPFQLGDPWQTAAEVFREAGYATGAFVSAAVIARDHNLDQGFDQYDDDVSVHFRPQGELLRSLEESLQGIERRAEDTVDRALEWLDAQDGRDLFLFVHLFDPHVPQDPPAPFDQKYAGRPYDGEIAYADQEIGRLLEELRRMRSGTRIHTVFTSDHGEGLGDHGEQLHGDLLFGSTVRVPLIIHGPDIEGGTRIPRLCRTVDILPTLCAFGGLDVPDWCVGAALPGVPLSPAEQARQAGLPHKGAAYLETLRPRLTHNWCELRGIQTSRWKLIQGPDLDLFDLSADPLEQNDLSSELPQVRDSLLTLMDAAALQAVRTGRHHGEALSITEQDREKLRSLGYLTPDTAQPRQDDSLAVYGFPPEERGFRLGLPDPRVRVAEAGRRIIADSFYSAGMAALEGGRLEEAGQRFEAAFRQYPRYADAYVGYARAATRAGRPDAALRVLLAARDSLPQSPAVAGALADALTGLGRPEAARQVLEEAVRNGYADSSLTTRLRDLR